LHAIIQLGEREEECFDDRFDTTLIPRGTENSGGWYIDFLVATEKKKECLVGR